MKELKFRTLSANEIECRVGSVSKDGKGFSLLLYKDARVDQRLLDEVVGAYNWQNRYEEIKGVLHCIVEIWDEDKQQWISKQNCGIESNTDAQKGEASDAFKRACFNLGIGRELYDSPFIWINVDADNTKHVRYEVTKLEYDNNRKCTELEIINTRTRKVVFSLGKKVSTPAQTPVQTQVSAKILDEIKQAQSLEALNTIWIKYKDMQSNVTFKEALTAQKKRINTLPPTE